MTRRAKLFCSLVAAQAACVAIGLWMLHNQLGSSLERAVEQRHWINLEHWSARVAGHTDERFIAELTARRSPTLNVAQLVHDRPASCACGTVVADGAWRVLAQADERTVQTGIAVGDQLKWVPSPDQSRLMATASRGWIQLPGGDYLAVRHPIAGDKAYVVAFQPVAAVRAEAATLSSPLGAVEGIALFWIVVVLCITSYVMLTRFHSTTDQKNRPPMGQIVRQAQTLLRTRDAVIFGLAKLADSRDADTGAHLERICAYSTLLAAELRRDTRYHCTVRAGFVRLIGISAALHDIGKVGIEDRILLKPGPLTESERTRMETHTIIGANCLQQIEHRLGSSNFLQMAHEIAIAHHERWDGSGYPYGLQGEAIPLAARIVAIADVYDALSSERVYKLPFPHEKCVEIIRNEAGKHFDPELVKIWLTIESRFQDIARNYSNETAEVEPAGRGSNAEAAQIGYTVDALSQLAQGDEEEESAIAELSLLE